jgi:hypothetical protein
MRKRICLALGIAVIISCLFTNSTAETPKPLYGFDVVQYETHGTRVFRSSLLEISKHGWVIWQVGGIAGHEVSVGRLPANLLARLQADIASLDIPTNEKWRENCAISADSDTASFIIIKNGEMRTLPDAICHSETAMKIRKIENELLDFGRSVVKPIKY